MLTNLRIRNFKWFNNVEIELGQSVVLVGPNNSGKTTVLQALALWEVGLRAWNEKRSGRAAPEKRPGVTINRRDLVPIPVPSADLLWRGVHVREGERAGGRDGKTRTRNIRIEIAVSGVSEGEEWTCGLEFDFSNEESFVCRPLRLPEYENVQVRQARFTTIPEAAAKTRVAYLPPMSGLSDREFIKRPGEIAFLIGQGQTAQVLRNLCFQIFESGKGSGAWVDFSDRIRRLFGVVLQPPKIAQQDQIIMEYQENGMTLDLSCSGRGLQQTLLLLAHLYANPGTVLVLDEPDAHLEILRQRQTYELLTKVAERQGSQIIAASHSEVLLNEAADRDIVISFVGSPHRIDDRGNQTAKALKEFGYEDYYQAEQRGWVLYLEGTTDLAILQEFAEKLEHPAAEFLSAPFLKTVCNSPQNAGKHFYGMREANRDLVGIALFDRLEKPLPPGDGLVYQSWRRREIENYLCAPNVLISFAGSEIPGGLFVKPRKELMERLIADRVPRIALRDPNDPYWSNVKATDDFLDLLFAEYYKQQGLPNLMRKTDYYELARHMERVDIVPEVVEKLDAILAVAQRAKPRTE
jgi:energy-coupling factor transporter ATP-binding protein EcfA2